MLMGHKLGERPRSSLAVSCESFVAVVIHDPNLVSPTFESVTGTWTSSQLIFVACRRLSNRAQILLPVLPRHMSYAVGQMQGRKRAKRSDPARSESLRESRDHSTEVYR